jgi:hypothetical protein
MEPTPAQRRQRMISPWQHAFMNRFTGIRISINGYKQAGFINSHKQPRQASRRKASKISATLDETHSFGSKEISFCPLLFSPLE